MAMTVWGAFDTFRKTTVDLSLNDTEQARASRDFLITQLRNVGTSVPGFPTLPGKNHYFGSFARKTKICPLDDIDLMIILNGTGTTETQAPSNHYRYWLHMDDKSKPLASFLDGYGYVNSTRILNKIRDSMASISQYSKAEIRKTHQAVTLNLKSYPWVFDVVPAVAITDGTGKIIHYLIPDGAGEWIRTDPRKDSENMTATNVQHGGNLLPIMRLLKYWNNRTGNKSRLPSYYFETLVIWTFQYTQTISSLQQGIKYFFDNGRTYLNIPCPDPKGLGPNLDANISWGTKQKIAAVMCETVTQIGYATMYEISGDHENAIYWWAQIFGPRFPNYGF